MNSKLTYPIIEIPNSIKLIITDLPYFSKPSEPEKPVMKNLKRPTPPRIQGNFRTFFNTLIISIICVLIVVFVFPNIDNGDNKSFYHGFLSFISLPLIIVSIISGLICYTHFVGMFKHDKSQEEYAHELNRYNSEKNENELVFKNENIKYETIALPKYQNEIKEYENQQNLLKNRKFIENYRLEKLKTLTKDIIINSTSISDIRKKSVDYFYYNIISKLKQSIHSIDIFKNVIISELSIDILIFLKEISVYIAISIEEPYNEIDGSPLHYISNNDLDNLDYFDRLVDNHFLRNNLILIKFAEIQIFKCTESCISLIDQAINKSMSLQFNNISTDKDYYGTLVKRWSKEEAYKQAYERNREKYIPLDIESKIEYLAFNDYKKYNLKENKNIEDLKLPLYSKVDIEKKLSLLSQIEPPKELSGGARCYISFLGPLEDITYICPKCNNRTCYEFSNDSYEFVDNKIVSCRRLLDNINEIDINIDESQFCKHCSPNITKPELNILVKLRDDHQYTLLQNISYDDIKLIDEFINGLLKHEGDRSGETPLISHIDRIKELLLLKK